MSHSHSHLKNFLMYSATAVAFFASSASLAQAEERVGDIVVTAQKREERLQEVPIAITALGAQQLEARGVATTMDLGALAPNVTTGATVQAAGDTTIAMRGLSASDTLMSNDYPVGIYIDGVISARLAGSVLDLVDLERVEVLRGPQGTLYGRNTTGGAVNFITRKPSREFHVTQKFTYQTQNGFVSRTAIDTGEWGDSGVSATLNFLYKNIDGYYDNLAQPDNKDPGAENVRALRAALNFDRGGRFRANYQIYHVEQENGSAISQLTAVSPDLSAVLVSPLVIDSRRRDEVNLPGLGTNDLNMTLHNLTAEYDLSDNIVLKSITGYRRFDDFILGSQFGEDVDFVSLDLTTFAPVILSGTPYKAQNSRTNEQFTQEIQINGQAGDKVTGGSRLAYSVGGYYFTERSSERSDQNLIVGQNLSGIPGIGFPGRAALSYNSSTKSWALFGQASYTPNILEDKLRLTAGLRYSSDDKETTAFPGLNVFVPVSGVGKGSFNAWTYLMKAQYFLTDDLNAYLSYSTGYKAGGFNTRGNLEGFGPEKLRALEVGVKAQWLDGRLQTNLAAFHNEARDQQVAQFVAGASGATQIVSNAGGSTYDGLEIELLFRPMKGLTFDTNLGFVNPKYDEYRTLDPVSLLAFDAKDVARFTYTSQTTGSAGVQYDSDPIAALRDGKIQARLEAVWQSKQDFHPAIVYPSGARDNPLINATTSDARTVVNARVALKDVSVGPLGRADFALWGKNLGDEEYVVQGIEFGALGFASQSFGAPLTAGFDVVFHY